MHSSGISIWFFNGILLTAYGFMIFVYGLSELVSGVTANVVLAELHAPVWWGGAMFLIGLFYLIKFRPGHDAK